ncbi:hypothetical protein PYCCODRAFT_1430521 [Trametes coccinea BRFM310]|uniref:Uncharacterized protein n=1 Tax=Trametes coccinea (strain BRFM310) TaxID=1353009 RepID=A0A1Y2J1K1_TRAC3|nr:hypothetical protein PYCCODRAFT_1430521 [Trametes coccinea BRFM310]
MRVPQERLRQVALDVTVVASGIRSGYLFDAFAIRDKRTTLRQVLEEYLTNLRNATEHFMDVALLYEPHSEQLFFANTRKLRERALRTSTLNASTTSSGPSEDGMVYLRLEGSRAEVSSPPPRLEPLLGKVSEGFAHNPSRSGLCLPDDADHLDIGTMVAFAAHILDFPVAYVPTSGSNTAYLAGVPLDVYECVLEADPATADVPRSHTMIKFSCPQDIGLTTRELSPENVVRKLRARFENRLRTAGFPGTLVIHHTVETLDRVAL